MFKYKVGDKVLLEGTITSRTEKIDRSFSDEKKTTIEYEVRFDSRSPLFNNVTVGEDSIIIKK